MKNSSAIRCFAAALLATAVACTPKVEAPEAILPIPSPEQVEWQKMETYAFVHFGLNTFNDREWGYGDSDPATFNPSRLDCEQWVKTFVAAGMKGVILTAKHHDGFCLWPTHLTEYCIRNTPYKHGQGDIVGELAAACKKHGLKLGLYLSPWDRNRSNYGSREYVDYYHAQLRELMSRYGEVFEVWFDGANGGDGWYGGACETRQIDNKTYYDYPTIFHILDELQPQAIVFGDGGPGCRWVGNEKGFAGATNWSFIPSNTIFPGYKNYRELQYGYEKGDIWVAAECDVSIRPGWFYHPEEDDRVKTVGDLTDLYYRSVGHNATFLLNFPVTREGLIHPIDSANAVRFRRNIEAELKDDLFRGVVPEVTDQRGKGFTAQAMTDDDYDTYWSTRDGITAATVTFHLPKTEKINRLLLQEYIPLGQRVRAFTVAYDHDGEWLPIQPGEELTTVGYKRLLRFPAIETDRIRIAFTDARASLCINRIAAYFADTRVDMPRKESAEAAGFAFSLPQVGNDECAKCTDKDAATVCRIEGDELLIDLGEVRTVASLHYLPDSGEYGKGLISNYALYAGDQADAPALIARGEFSNIAHNPTWQSVYFTPTQARYIRLKAERMVHAGEPMGFAEIRIR